MPWTPHDSDWRMTALFLLALGLLGFVVKLVALLMPSASSTTRWAFVLSPLPSNDSLDRAPPLSTGPQAARRTGFYFGAVLLNYWAYWGLMRATGVHGWVLGYLAAPSLLVISELFSACANLVWVLAGQALPRLHDRPLFSACASLLRVLAGQVLPPLHNRPLLAGGVAEFWGRRWNLWFRDWFRSVIFKRLTSRPAFAVCLVFLVSGLMHEWVINVPLYFVTGKKYFGSMMLYFLLQAAGVLLEHRVLRRKTKARIVAVWLVVLGPAPLVINEGLLRALHLWPG